MRPFSEIQAEAEKLGPLIAYRPGPGSVREGSLVFEAGALVRGGRVWAIEPDEDGSYRVHCVRWKRGEIVTCELTADQLDPDIGPPDHFAVATLIGQCGVQLARHKANSPGWRFLFDVMNALVRIHQELTR